MKALGALQQDVIAQDLCSACGVCAGVCPTGAVGFRDGYSCRPDVFSPDVCTDCRRCVEACPGRGYPLYVPPAQRAQFHPDLGHYRRLWRAASTDAGCRESATSGGAATEILRFLLEEKRVHRVMVVVHTDDLKDGLARSFLTDRVEDVFRARGSKYVQVPIAGVTREVLRSEGTVAVVGLPCQLAGLHRAAARLRRLRDRIVFRVGLFCGYSYSPRCIRGLLAYMGLTMDQVRRIVGWRHGGIPGHFAVETRDGQARQIPFIHEHCIDVPFYTPLRCHLCADWAAVHADVSLGDVGGWERETLVLSRTLAGERLIDSLADRGRLSVQAIDARQVWRTTVLGFMNEAKKERSRLFSQFLQRQGNAVPSWDVQYHPVTMATRWRSTTYFRDLLAARRRLAHYEANPSELYREGKRLYLDVWGRPLYRILLKLERLLRRQPDAS